MIGLLGILIPAGYHLHLHFKPASGANHIHQRFGRVDIAAFQHAGHNADGIVIRQRRLRALRVIVEVEQAVIAAYQRAGLGSDAFQLPHRSDGIERIAIAQRRDGTVVAEGEGSLRRHHQRAVLPHQRIALYRQLAVGVLLYIAIAGIDLLAVGQLYRQESIAG